MKLLKLEITEFGGLSGMVLEPGAGLNIIEGNNESGKSTVLAFIRFMLFGLSGRLGAQEPSDKERYPSWSGGRAAGSMTVATSDARVWRIEREGTITHSARGDSYSEKPVRIFDDATGELIYRGECPGELFLGLTVQMFNSTCAVSQLKNTDINTGELSEGIENMLRSADENISVPRVCKRLEDSRRELIHKTGRGGKIYELKCECQRLSDQLERAESNARTIVELEALLAECRAKTAEASAEAAKLDRIWERSEAWLVIGRFEERDALEAEQSERCAQLEHLRATTFPGGHIPARGYDDRLCESAERVSAASIALEQAEKRYEQHVSLPSYDQKLAERAEKFESDGMARDTVVGEYSRRSRKLTSRRAGGTFALSAGIVTLITGLALLFILKLTLPGAIVAGAGLVSGLIGAALLSTLGRARADVASYLTSLGLDGDTTAAGSAGIIRYYDDCMAALRGKVAHDSATQALDAVRNNCRETLAREIAQAKELLRPILGEKTKSGSVGAGNGSVGAENGAVGAENGAIGAESGSIGAENGAIGAGNGSIGSGNGAIGAENGAVGAENGAVDAKIVTPSPADICAALRTASADCRRFARQCEELERDIASRKAQLDRLSESLSGYDRQFILQKASRLDRSQVIGDEEHRLRREQCAKAVREAYDNQTALERRIAVAEAQGQPPARISAQLDAARTELSRLEHKADAVSLALEAINTASGQLRRGFTPALRSEAEKLLDILTDGRLDTLGIGEELSLSTQLDGVTRSAALLSGGTRDAVYLAVRLALTRLLCRNEMPPLLFDESLTQLDDDRAARVIAILSGWCRAGGQCLLFTCHSREAGMARDTEGVSVIRMPVRETAV